MEICHLQRENQVGLNNRAVTCVCRLGCKFVLLYTCHTLIWILLHNYYDVLILFCVVSSPTITELLHFRTGDGHINIPREVGTKYHNLGAQLLLETFRYIRSLERELDKNAERINCQIFQEWLDGKGRKPTSWATLVGVLNDIEMGELAKKIETSLETHTPKC